MSDSQQTNIDENASTTLNIKNLGEQFVFDQDERAVQVSSLWERQPAILIFLRHFGCVTCRAHAKEVWQCRDVYERAGSKIYFIGNGAPYYISKFKSDLGIESAPIFTDPSLSTFRQAGFKRSFFNALSPTSLANSLKLYLKGHKQGSMDPATGDPWQLGGVVVVCPKLGLRYHYISEAAGDYPPFKDPLEQT